MQYEELACATPQNDKGLARSAIDPASPWSMTRPWRSELLTVLCDVVLQTGALLSPNMSSDA
jgi:hypothetical protein